MFTALSRHPEGDSGAYHNILTPKGAGHPPAGRFPLRGSKKVKYVAQSSQPAKDIPEIFPIELEALGTGAKSLGVKAVHCAIRVFPHEVILSAFLII
jgi:hypothetical protein